MCSKLLFPFCGGRAGVQTQAADFARAEARTMTGTTQTLCMNQGKEIAEKDGYGHGLWARWRTVDPDFLSYQSRGMHVPFHAAGFAMLSLTPVMGLGCVLVT
jgi:hypothetical protein